MFETWKFNSALVTLVAIPGGLLYFYQHMMISWGLTPEGFKLLTPAPPSSGFEPAKMPNEPVIENRSPPDLAFAFGYMVRSIPFSYTMKLNFRGQSDNGMASVSVRHAGGISNVTAEVVRGWDRHRKAYAVVVRERFDTDQAVPSLCIKAVIGPRPDGLDTSGASICVAERDVPGDCRLETLACGLIR